MKSLFESTQEVLFSKDIEQRIFKFPELPADRADIFPAGLLSVECVMNFLGVTQMTHSYYNLRHGLISYYAENGRLF